MSAQEIVSNITKLNRFFTFFDEAYYLAQVEHPLPQEALAHYLKVGWQKGFEPNRHFDGKFLLPYYNTSNVEQAPALTWISLAAMTGYLPPVNRNDAEVMARRVRNSPFFDAVWYARQLPDNLDPALHYVVVGERMGWRPSLKFDPSYYLDRYPDVDQAGVSPLWHFETVGRKEGRRPVSVADRLEFPPLKHHNKPVVLLVCHDASRSGAPVLGWNLAMGLADRYDVISLVMHEGPLEADFAAASAAFVGPMTWEEWHPAETNRVAERIVSVYKPIYAIANSIETHLLVPPLVERGVPTVALVHEFAAYTRPVSRMRDIFDWATHVVFPAAIVIDSSFRAFSDLKSRNNLHLMPQGQSILPGKRGNSGASEIVPQLRQPEEKDAFVVLGVGSVEIRKGVDLFISAAATAQRLRPETKFRFVWIGHGYDPIHDTAYSCYLAEQIVQSNLSATMTLLQPIANLELIYRQADAFFLCSRLDPQPNVGIDAITRGIPTICFAGASGTAEVLMSDPKTRHLVVPHLDCHLAGQLICDLWDNKETLQALRADIARVGRVNFDMKRYIDRIADLGQDAAAQLKSEDLEVLIRANIVDPTMLLPPGTQVGTSDGEAERLAVVRWDMWNNPEGSMKAPMLRRPCAGFHPQKYAHAHPEACIEKRQNPLLHWVRRGCPIGPWSRQVYGPSTPVLNTGCTPRIRVALHGHFYYPDLAIDLRSRLSRNSTTADLFLSTDTEDKARLLRHTFDGYAGRVDVRSFPNKGRDLAPFLTGFWEPLFGRDYDVLGHIHGKQSAELNPAMGDVWRTFLWDNLIGDEHPMLDIAVKAFENDPKLGLLFAEDPHLVSWNDNMEIAELLAARMKLSSPLERFFDFPLGTMFWARPAGLQPLLDLKLDWDDYPSEPLPYDGTVLHALERLMPFIVAEHGFSSGGLRAPDTSW
jgi:glycosyltransferase involved in cell wall biosynthesis